MKKRRSIFAYVIIALVGLCLCSVIATALNRGSSPSASPGIAPAVTIFATQTEQAPATALPTAEPTATDTPPTSTTAPTDAPLPTIESARPTAQIEAPTALPVASAPAVPVLPPLVSANATGMDGDRPFVDPPWLPCQQGQIKGNIDSGLYHPPTGRHYRFTFVDIRCFDTEDAARMAGFEPSKQ